MSAQTCQLHPDCVAPDFSVHECPLTPWDRWNAARLRVESLARRVADSAPAKQGAHTFRAGVPWTLIHELRAAITELDAVTEKDEGERA